MKRMPASPPSAADDEGPLALALLANCADILDLLSVVRDRLPVVLEPQWLTDYRLIRVILLRHRDFSSGLCFEVNVRPV